MSMLSGDIIIIIII